jgi:hypothetical protein
MSTPGTGVPNLMNVYNAIKAQEANFPIPQTAETYVVGTFNAALGRFTYSVPTYTEIESTIDPQQPRLPVVKPHPITLTGGKVTALNSQNAVLQFNVINRQGRDFVLSVPGFPDVHAPQGQDYVTLNVGKAGSINQFTLRCGREYISQLPLQISYQTVGAGVFTIPALPVAIIYAPPADQNNRNSATWSFGNTTGTSVSILSAIQNSSSAPQFSLSTDLANAMQAASQVLQKIPYGPIQTAAQVLGTIGGELTKAFGQTTVTTTVGTSSSNQRVLTLMITQQDTVTTNPQSGGPGIGDLVSFLVNARLCWFAYNGVFQLALLGWDAVSSMSVATLKTKGAQTGLDPATIQALLALDPFVAGGPQASLPRPRFELVLTEEINAQEFKHSETYTFTQQDTSASAQTNSTVTDMQAGWLSFLGIGPAQSGTNTVTMSFSKSTQNTVGRTVTDTVDLFAGPNEIYAMEIYMDVIFGTFAYRTVPVVATAQLTGTVLDNFNKPVPFAEVTLVNNGRRFVTRANAQGNYAFHSASITPGNSTITYGQAQLQVAFAGKPLGNLNLKTAALRTA